MLVQIVHNTCLDVLVFRRGRSYHNVSKKQIWWPVSSFPKGWTPPQKKEAWPTADGRSRQRVAGCFQIGLLPFLTQSFSPGLAQTKSLRLPKLEWIFHSTPGSPWKLSIFLFSFTAELLESVSPAHSHLTSLHTWLQAFVLITPQRLRSSRYPVTSTLLDPKVTSIFLSSFMSLWG